MAERDISSVPNVNLNLKDGTVSRCSCAQTKEQLLPLPQAASVTVTRSDRASGLWSNSRRASAPPKKSRTLCGGDSESKSPVKAMAHQAIVWWADSNIELSDIVLRRSSDTVLSRSSPPSGPANQFIAHLLFNNH